MNVSHAPVSVIIPTYNSAAFLRETVESVLAQTLPPAQIIVVDDGSTDDTVQRLSPFRDRVTYCYQENGGVSAARNTGVAMAHQPLVAFLDADDTWHPSKLELQVEALRRRQDLVLLGADAYDWPSRQPLNHVADDRVIDIAWRQLVVKNRLITSSVVAVRQVLLEAGPFDTAMQGPEDRDMWIRLAERGGVARLSAPLVGYRAVGATSVSRQARRCYDGMRRIMHKLDQRGAWRGDWLLRRKALSYIEHSCAWIYGAAGEHRTAARMLARSFLMYPLPYDREEVGTRLERPKRLAVNLLRAAGVMGGEAARAIQPSTALQ
jgi:glycosyltransferase involved in cell wall biosynthesis